MEGGGDGNYELLRWTDGEEGLALLLTLMSRVGRRLRTDVESGRGVDSDEQYI